MNLFGHYYKYLAAAWKNKLKVCAPSGHSDKLWLLFSQSDPFPTWMGLLGCTIKSLFYSVR